MPMSVPLSLATPLARLLGLRDHLPALAEAERRELTMLRNKVPALEAQRWKDAATIEELRESVAAHVATIADQFTRLRLAEEGLVRLRAELAEHEAERARRPVPYRRP